MVVNKQLKPSLNILELLSERTISETESLSYAKWTFGTMVVNKQLKPNQNIYELLSERTISETELSSYANWTFGTMPN